MSIGMLGGAALTRFDDICKAIAGRGRGLTLTQLADIAALAEEEAKPDPDPERLAMLRGRLGIEGEE